MKLTLLLLLAVIPAASAFGLFGHLWTWHNREQCTCTSMHIPLDDKLTLIGQDNDHDNDGSVTYDDVYYDVSTRYDKNDDGRMSEGECVEHWSCRYGDTEQVAQFVCANLLQGESSMEITAFNIPPFSTTGLPLTQFLGANRARYEQFSTRGCLNSHVTLDEKLTLNAANNDHNGDGLVTSEDIEYVLANLYDADKDGQVTKAEFVIGWTCNYGDRGDYARYLWDSVIQGASAISTTAFSGPPYDTGVPIEQFTSTNRQNYKNFWTSDASAYIQHRP